MVDEMHRTGANHHGSITYEGCVRKQRKSDTIHEINP